MLRTKVICTLGPASSTPEVVQEMVSSGMDVARINMSHGDHGTHGRLIELVREAADRVGRPVALLADLQGPKIRVGQLPAPVELVVGETVTMAREGAGDPDAIPVSYDEFAQDVGPRQAVLLDDGLLWLRVKEVDGENVRLEVVRGGTLNSRKGINLPEVDVRAPSTTEKDLTDLEFVLDQGVDYVGLSFVRHESDIQQLRRRVGKRALIVAKIELARALDRVESIIDGADVVMVARGDLGVDLPFEQVPLVQKRVIQLANFSGRPVITATQMVESMIEYPRPTRAEASDVANAILDGTDAVMLSGESAVGRYPLQALNALVRIIGEIERSGVLERGPRYLVDPGEMNRTGASAREHAVASASVESAHQLEAPAIIVITRSGFTARLVASYRPPVPIFAVCTDETAVRQLSAVWGVKALLAGSDEVSYESMTEFGKSAVVDAGIGEPGESVVVTAGYPFHEARSTNTMRVEQL
jgi:pyruvate kinase